MTASSKTVPQANAKLTCNTSLEECKKKNIIEPIYT